MPIKNITRENIHGGLSSVKNDNKWSDLVNWRSNGNRTVVVPKKYKFIKHEGGLHSVFRGLGGINYALGSDSSIGFRAQTGLDHFDLWELKTTLETVDTNLRETPKLRGNFTGTIPKTFLLEIVDDAVEPLPTDNSMKAVEGYEPELFNGNPNTQPSLLIEFWDAVRGENVAGVEFSIYRGTTLILESQSMGNGKYRINFAPETYTIYTKAPDCFNEIDPVQVVVTEDQTLQINLDSAETLVIAARDPWVPPFYGYEGYMVLELYESGNPSNKLILNTFTTLEGAPTFYFDDYLFACLPVGHTYDMWTLYETGFNMLYFDEPLGT